MRRPQPVVVAAFYLFAYVAADSLAQFVHRSTGASPWYWGAALTLALLWIYGLRWLPLAFVAPFLPSALRHGGLVQQPLDHAIDAAISTAVYGLTAALLRGPLAVTPPLRGARSAFVFALVGGVFGPLAAGAGWIGWEIARGTAGWGNAEPQFRAFWLGDAAGILTLVPLLAFAAARRSERAVATGSMRRGQWMLLGGLLVAGVTAAFALGAHDDPADFLAWTFPVVAWMAVRGGLPAACAGNGLLMLSVLIETLLVRSEPTMLVHAQFVVVFEVLTAITIGGLSTERAQGWRTRRRLESELRRVAYTDPVSGLPNRAALDRWLAESELEKIGYVAALGVDHLGAISDGLGRAAADGAVRTIADRIAEGGRDAAYVAHLGTEGFILVGRESDARPVLAEIAARFEAPIGADDQEVYASLSVGVAYARDGCGSATLLRDAAVALRRARRDGGARVVAYEPSMDEDIRRVPLIAGLRRALERGDFALYEQPIYRLGDDDAIPVGVEALLRWHDAEGRLREPASFIDVLESTPLAERVGWWVIDACCARARALIDEGMPLAVWANVGPRQLVPSFADEVADRLWTYGLEGRSLVIEVNERIVASEREIGPTLHALRALGVTIAIDDFGTGHSSLSRLRELPIDIMKLDRSFVSALDADDRAKGVVVAILRLAEELGVITLAEGIETDEQLRFLVERGCLLGQGYALQRPQPSRRVDLLPRTVLRSGV